MSKKEYIVNWDNLSADTVYSVKNKTTLYFTGVKLSELSFFIDANKNLICQTESHILKLSDYSSVKYVKTDEPTEDESVIKTVSTNIISDSKVDNTGNVITTYKKGKVSGTKYNDLIKVESYTLYDKNEVEKDDTAKKLKGLTITTSTGEDEVFATKYKDTIKTGDGDDTIHSSLGNDSITCGRGTNKIIYSGEFDTDTINLTKNENLILDLTSYGYTDLGDIKYEVSGKNLVLSLYNDVKCIGSIVLKNFSKSNVLSSGKITVLFSESLKIEDLNSFNLLSYKAQDFSKKGVFNGSRFSESINAYDVPFAYDGKNKGVTINGGAGYNTIYSTDSFTDKITGGNDGNNITLYSGTKTVTTGSGADVINVNGAGTKTIKAGKGANVININSNSANNITTGSGSDNFYQNTKAITNIHAGSGTNTITIDNSSEFGMVTIYEEKVKAINNIVFTDDFDSSVFYVCKNGNNLVLTDDHSVLTLVNYYKSNKKNATYNFSVAGVDKTISEIISSVKGFKITGKGTIRGTELNDFVVTNDSDSEVKESNDYIYAGKDNDVINAGRGVNYIYFYEDDGNDTVLNGGGIDTLVFEKDTDIFANFDNDDLILYYGKGDDSIRIKDYTSGTSVKFIQVGNLKDSLSSYLSTISMTISESQKDLVVDGTGITLVLKNEYNDKNYSYRIKAINENQLTNASFTYLENGRLLISGDDLKIIASDGQKDDIILMGDNNQLDTSDEDDIVRVGHVIDSDDVYYENSYSNSINTGDGNDYVTFAGVGFSIDTGEGVDRVLLSKLYSNVEKVEKDDCTKFVFTFEEEEIDDPEDSPNTCVVKNCEDTRLFSKLTDSYDGQVGWFNQGNDGGDCRLFALLDSLSRSKNFSSLSDYFDIETDDGENYTVTFKKSTADVKSATVSLSEITTKMFDEETPLMYVAGDLDIVLIDYALNKILKAYGSSVEIIEYNDLSDYILGNSDITYINMENTDFFSRLNSLYDSYKSGEIDNLTIGIHNTEFRPEYDIGIVPGHAYSVKELTDDYVKLINPWDNADFVTISMEKFRTINPCAIVYGVDIYNEPITLLNRPPSVNNLFCIDEINSEVSMWLSSDVQDAAVQYTNTNLEDISVLVSYDNSLNYNDLT